MIDVRTMQTTAQYRAGEVLLPEGVLIAAAAAAALDEAELVAKDGGGGTTAGTAKPSSDLGDFVRGASVVRNETATNDQTVTGLGSEISETNNNTVKAKGSMGGGFLRTSAADSCRLVVFLLLLLFLVRSNHQWRAVSGHIAALEKKLDLLDGLVSQMLANNK